ncbi:MAG: hypothetical protein EXX96DRAFT_484732 [Benjaminiella poitrasii]|nr:MAG: hypothetical protein EXX96DRAFT_484732 [Benjaminiella poitrasii]
MVYNGCNKPNKQVCAKSVSAVSTFSDEEDLKTRIVDACNNVPIQHVKAFIQHSCNQFEKCRNKEPL